VNKKELNGCDDRFYGEGQDSGPRKIWWLLPRKGLQPKRDLANPKERVEMRRSR